MQRKLAIKGCFSTSTRRQSCSCRSRAWVVSCCPDAALTTKTPKLDEFQPETVGAGRSPHDPRFAPPAHATKDIVSEQCQSYSFRPTVLLHPRRQTDLSTLWRSLSSSDVWLQGSESTSSSVDLIPDRVIPDPVCCLIALVPAARPANGAPFE